MSDLDDKVEALLERATDKTVDGNYSLWNALLTMDTIIITVFTAGLIYLDPQVQAFVFPSILLALLSAVLLILNFKATRDTYKYQGILGLGRVTELTEEQRAADMERSRRRHDWTVRRENFVIWITGFQGVLVAILAGYIVFFHK
jgi:hypothetical protein